MQFIDQGEASVIPMRTAPDGKVTADKICSKRGKTQIHTEF